MKKHASKLATIGGLLTSLGVAAVVDWDTFDFHNPAHICKLFFILVPAIGGWLTTLK